MFEEEIRKVKWLSRRHGAIDSAKQQNIDIGVEILGKTWKQKTEEAQSLHPF